MRPCGSLAQPLSEVFLYRRYCIVQCDVVIHAVPSHLVFWLVQHNDHSYVHVHSDYEQ